LVLVIGAPPYDINKDTLFENAGLKQYEKPKEIVFIDYLPVNENGKINRIDMKLTIDK
jgi:acyl-coenzyme A synthetase/AMP-(fatty) acid ligase